ncbi:MBL fold metallo-hydrolase [Paenibacillus gallinarum]|uniref:MBL fold metallo-hydrolase n=1 Tax=Paenibacillus gallinarum TaxID=2762232 RepID=A0ABR8T2D0_9BACL|nr:MBL fold metallo-hydrolase [Paenibacillus gallinarum]MBD7969780.1 MBL fold metallo-hydrolase [Paenibacillus gallinarum]
MKLPEWTFHEEEELTRVKISMSGPLRWVNSYLWRGEKGVVIVDPGPRSNQTEEEWHVVWNALSITPQEITDIVLTHHHPDHYGLAGWMQEQTGASVWMSRRAHQEAEFMWGREAEINHVLPVYFRSHGMTEIWTEQLLPHLESFDPQVSPTPLVQYVEEGAFEVGGRTFQVIETSGHAPGHLSFYEADRELILCGDAVLPQISPNISLLPGSDPEPLLSFMQGLDELGALSVRKAFPGHRHPMRSFHERISSLKIHHEERLNQIEKMIGEQPQSAFEVCTALFGQKFGIHQMRFAMAESLAHLQELVRQGRADLTSITEQGSKHPLYVYVIKTKDNP